MDLSERSEVAARHPWELARSTFFRNLVADSVDLERVTALLDIGAGDGWFAHELVADLPLSTAVTCWDINYTSDDLNSVLPPRIARTVDRPTGAFDVVLLMDVLEHVADDQSFLEETVVPLLGPHGTLIVSVPAHPGLFSAHDTMLGHHRRYRPIEISALLGRSLRIVSDGSLFSSLTVLRAAQVGVEKVRGGRAEVQRGIGGWSHGDVVTKTVTAALHADARLGLALARRGRRLPGLSYWAVCRPRP